jgi:hypothetical protein
MKRRRKPAPDIPPLILAAMARTPRVQPGGAPRGEGVQKTGNNYIAEAPQKARPGAKKGNRNAVTHGRYTMQIRARRAAVKALVADICALADAVLKGCRDGKVKESKR